MKKMANKFHQVAITIKIFGDFAVHITYAIPSSRSTDDRRQCQCLNVVLNDITGPCPLFWEFNRCEENLAKSVNLPLSFPFKLCQIYFAELTAMSRIN